MKLDQLVSSIVAIQEFSQSQAVKQVNQWLTIRNWLIGAYITEFENGGEDRAAYGAQIIETIADNLGHKGLKGMSSTNLRHFVSFYSIYPNIRQTLSGILGHTSISADIFQTLSGKFSPLSDTAEIRQTPSGEFNESTISPETTILLNSCSWSHFIEFIRMDDPLKRSFYEVQTVNQTWSVRQLRRATDSMLYERTGLSKDKPGVISSFDAGKKISPDIVVRDPYILEFLNLAERPQYSESDLEQAIIDNLQDFLIEMGEGFCFEARQRRITFGNTHYYIDLVFYHRILKCHVLIDLKIGKFNHADSGQMNVYLNYYKDQMYTEGDNPPIGIILCADKDDSLVQYATGGMDQQLFVSQYLVKLPSEEALKALIQRQSNIL